MRCYIVIIHPWWCCIFDYPQIWCRDQSRLYKVIVLTKRCSAAVYYVSIVLYGVAGGIFSGTWMRYCVAWAEAYADDMRRIGNLHR